MKIVIIDNYDSFTYNLSHLVKELGAEVTVLRNDQFKLEDLEPARSLYWVCVWDIRPSARHSVVSWKT